MKFLTIWIGLLAVAIMSDIIAANDSSQENDQDYLKRVLQTILKDPEYLSLGLAEQQQILIAFFHILDNPNQYGNTVRKIFDRFYKPKVARKLSKYF
jgi:hypothetical protein